MDKPAPPTELPPTRLPTAASLDLTGRTLGDFRVLRRLGQGGMGQVYLAEQVSLKRKVALKILRPELASNLTALQRFKTEAEAVARATHANIVQVYAIGDLDGMPYMALEYVEGRNLREFLARKGPPELPLAISIMRQVASALQRASELGIVHRDVKPENILLTRKGEVKVADFGLSRCLDDGQAVHLTQSGVTMGTPLYMSPEQVEGRQLDCRTDIYSFGVTCYHMLAGQPPFQGSNAFEVALQHVRATPAPLASVRPDLPELLCAIVHKMMARDPAQRYQTGRELLKDLTRLREGLSGVTAALAAARAISVELVPTSSSDAGALVKPLVPASTSATSVEPFAAAPRRHGWLWALFVGSVLLAAAGGVGFGWMRRHGQASTPSPAADVPKENAEEQSLRHLVDVYLKPDKDVPRGDLAFGYRLCQELGVLYLSQNRLDEAEKLFRRLESADEKRFHALGKVGRAVVLALRETPATARESNDLLKVLFIRPLEAKNPQDIGNRLWQGLQPRFRELVVRAVRANLRNGVPEASIPSALQPLLKNPK